jgi:hypothetical protein
MNSHVEIFVINQLVPAAKRTENHCKYIIESQHEREIMIEANIPSVVWILGWKDFSGFKHVIRGYEKG